MFLDKISCHNSSCHFSISLALLFAEILSLYLFSSTLVWSFSPSVFVLITLAGYFYRNRPSEEMKPIEFPSSPPLTICATAGILFLIAYTAALNIEKESSALPAFFALVSFAALFISCAINAWRLGLTLSEHFSNESHKGHQKKVGLSLHKEDATHRLLLLMLMVIGALTLPLSITFSHSVLPISAEMGMASALVVPLRFGNTSVAVGIDALFSFSSSPNGPLATIRVPPQSLWTVVLLQTALVASVAWILWGSRLSRNKILEILIASEALMTDLFEWMILPGASPAFLAPSFTTLIAIYAGCLLSLQPTSSNASTPKPPASADLESRRYETALMDRFCSMGLSMRESTVLSMRTSGKSYNEIGSILKISPSTARTYYSRGLQKVGNKNLEDALMRMDTVRVFTQQKIATSSSSEEPPQKYRTPMKNAFRRIPIGIFYILGICAGMTGWMIDSYATSWVIVLAVLLLLAIAAKEGCLERNRFLQIFPAVLLSLALGIAVANGILNAGNRLLVFLDSMGSTQTGRQHFYPLIIVVPTICLTLIILGLSTLKQSEKQDNSHKAAFVSSDERYESLLRIGLTPLYADIMLCVANGLSPAQISEQLHVARSTVKDAKLKGYSALSAHSAQEFREKLANQVTEDRKMQLHPCRRHD